MRSSCFFFLIALYFGAHVAKAKDVEPDVSFSLLGATSQTYKQFITDLRTTLITSDSRVGSQVASGIPVLQPTAVGRARYKLVKLTNYKSESINLVIDVVNVYVVAYEGNEIYYSLNDTLDEVYDIFYKGVNFKHVKLSYKGNYDGLETAAGRISREKIYLGFSEISSSIGNMYHHKDGNLVARGFIVSIQAVSEAARFKYIEQTVSVNVETKFLPDPSFLSLENNWSGLSKQIQIAQNRGGRFSQTIKLRTIGNNEREVKDVSSPIVSGIALLLHYKVSHFATNNIITMLNINTVCAIL